MNASLRKTAVRVLLWLPVVFTVIWFINQERLDFEEAREVVSEQARHAALAEGQVIQLRLMQQFQQLAFVAKAIVGEQAPEALDSRAQALLRRYVANHPEILAINVLTPDGERIAWSSYTQSTKPIFRPEDFTALPGRPDEFLGQDHYAKRFHADVVSMRYRMRDAHGQTLYFIGTPYRMDALLAELSPQGWTMSVLDQRDGRLMKSPTTGPVPQSAHSSDLSVVEPINGLPLSVRVAWPRAKVWQLYRQGLALRLFGRLIVLGLFVLAAFAISRLLRSRERLLEKNARFARFNALLAHINQAIAQASDVSDLLERACRLAVRDAGIALAWIGRPDSQGRFVFLAKAGAAVDYVNDLILSSDASVPEGQGSAGVAWREDRAIFTSDAQHAASLSPWRERLQRFGLNAGAALPLRRSKTVWAVLHLYFVDSAAVTPDLQRILLDLADDLSNGLDRLDLRDSQIRLQRQHACLLGNTVAGVVMVRYPGAIIAEANEAVARIFGAPSVRELLGRKVGDVVPSLLDDRMVQATRVALKEGQVTLDALDILRLDGQQACIAISGRRLESDPGGSTLVVWTVVDVTERQHLVRQLEQLSRADPLTGLPNRRALEQHLDRAIDRASRLGCAVAVGLIDLDDFKAVNDRYGHETGDVLLKQLGERLLACTRGSDLIARLGGDEFVLVIEDIDPEDAMMQLSVIFGRLHQTVETPFDLGEERSASVGMSMGVALAPKDSGNADSLLRLADAAMYRIKARKSSRTQWWGLVSLEHLDEAPEPPFDPFGSDAQMLLDPIHDLLELVEREFVETFYVELAQRAETAAIFSALNDQELARLKSRQAAHLRFLLDSATTAAQIQERGRHLGTVHALVGVASSWLSVSMQLYRDLLHWHLDASDRGARERGRLQRIFDARIQIDLQSQLDAMLVVQNAYNAYLARPLPRPGQAWFDVIEGKLQALGALPGLRGCTLLRPDAMGKFQVQGSAGEAADSIVDVLSTPRLQPSLDANSQTGMGLAAQAWRNESILTARNYESSLGLAPWVEYAARLNIRSMAAIPLMRAGQTDSVLVLYGAYPNQFDTQQGHTFLAALQNRWNLVDDLLRKRSPVVGQREAAQYRQWLYADGLRMFVQPVVDLIDGRLRKVEALARLVSPEGKVIAPGQFLPALREADLDALFRMGLSQSLERLAHWRAQGMDIDLSINLPPSTLLHPDCTQWIQQSLREHAIAPHHLVLELLESQEVDEILRDEAISRLGQLGVQFAIDDLGSGFSSLKRLASLPFDVIKVDQGIILDIERDPVKALTLVRTVVQIGRDFEKEVVVEGVENDGIIEAVTVLGAKFGQGYGIARPMPSEQLQDWAVQHAMHRRTNSSDPAPLQFSTPLGALAYHWMDAHGAFPNQMHRSEPCPLNAYLSRLGAEAAEAESYHAIIHEAQDEEVRKAASKKLTAWLVEKVRLHHKQ
ncbi:MULTISPECIES: EAL domain-containing protein [unclassified Thiomonas]|nr:MULTISPECIES: EAL domain-containing protein [unclassified Thiomonas]VDY14974.1 hypothetical protein; putative exported protein; putative EAL, GGDEF, GAF, PAS/PAC domains [Thiomonas sp. OC7]VDY15849.1 conserved protein of unknown function [Thiomonas sp. CB2]